jgi:hypothetical protein
VAQVIAMEDSMVIYFLYAFTSDYADPPSELDDKKHKPTLNKTKLRREYASHDSKMCSQTIAANG